MRTGLLLTCIRVELRSGVQVRVPGTRTHVIRTDDQRSHEDRHTWASRMYRVWAEGDGGGESRNRRSLRPEV